MAYRFWRAPSLWRAVALAAAIGLGAMARAELFVLVPFVLIPMVLARRQVPWPSSGVANEPYHWKSYLRIHQYDDVD